LSDKISDNFNHELILDVAGLKPVLECLFFVSNEPLFPEKLMQICQTDEMTLQAAISQLKEEYQGKGFHLLPVAGGWQFYTDPGYAAYVEKLYRPKMQQLSRAALETLAIIAYKQPITRGEIENIRQVNIDGVVNTLLEKSLICDVGRRNTPGRPVLYGTTQDFLRFFGLNSLQELPSMESMIENMEQNPIE